ncbi:zinc knuckle CX2CX4HX4C containing protein, partial [Tanacetum coccineum]
MPFGLKSARATYQMLVDMAFQSQIRRNLEAYVDDMVIKSNDDKVLIADIAETFDNLRKINMKLNPKKCSFGVKEGKFLGYIVTSDGIRANPKKTKAISDIKSLRTLREMQSLTVSSMQKCGGSFDKNPNPTLVRSGNDEGNVFGLSNKVTDTSSSRLPSDNDNETTGTVRVSVSTLVESIWTTGGKPTDGNIPYGCYPTEGGSGEDDIKAILSSFCATIDNVVGKKSDVNTSSMRTHVDVVAKLFGVSLKTLEDIDSFTKDIELGKYEVWSELTSDSGNTNLDDTMHVDPIVQSISIQDKPSSYVAAAGGSLPEPSAVAGKVVETVSTQFANTLYGYFIIKRIAFPVMEYYVRNNWGKYGLTRIMMNSKGFFFFQFKTLKGLEDVLDNRPWMIRNNPVIIKKWSMNTSLCKEELTRILVWVKIHDVPIQVFSEDGLSIIASQIGKPIMLDSYTSSMCMESWGRSSFAQCLIEINVEDVLKESLTMGVPLIEGTGFIIETATIEYEWKPLDVTYVKYLVIFMTIALK